MSEFQICMCGVEPGYLHALDCPRPLFNATEAQADRWEQEREAKRAHNRALADKRNQARRDRNACMKELGLHRVKGALGGTYWE